MDLRRPRIGAFTGYPFTGYELTGYPFTGFRFGEDIGTGVDFAMIWNGEPPYYATYTRTGTAYASSPTGATVEVPQDVPPYEYIDGDKVARFYEGTNIIAVDGEPTDSTDGLNVNAAVCNPAVITGFGGVNYYCIEIHTEATGVLAVTIPLPTLVLEPYSWRIEAFMTVASIGELDCYVNYGAFENIGLTVAEIGQEDLTPSATNRDLFIRTQGAPVGTKLYFRLTQMTKTAYQLPTIIGSKDGPVTVNPATTSLLAEDYGGETARKPWTKTVPALSGYGVDFLTKTLGAYDVNDYDYKDVPINLPIYTTAGTITANGLEGSPAVWGFTPLSYTEPVNITVKVIPEALATTALYTLRSNLTTTEVAVGLKRNGADLELTYISGVGATPPTPDRVIVAGPDTNWRYNDFVINATLDGLSLTTIVTMNTVEIVNETVVYSTVDGVGGYLGVNGFSMQEIAVEQSIATTTVKYGLKGLLVGVNGDPATGRVIGEKFITHDLSVNQPIIQFETSDFVALYVEATTGLIKGYDGTNTCVSPSALVIDTEYNFIFTWDEDEMWITLGTVLGTEVTFAGTFPAIGNRLFGYTSGTYQTNRNTYFDNDLDSGNNNYLSTYLASFLGG